MTDTDIAALIARLRKQAWRRSGAPKMDAGHVKMLEWKAADAIEALQARAEKAEIERDKAGELIDADLLARAVKAEALFAILETKRPAIAAAIHALKDKP